MKRPTACKVRKLRSDDHHYIQYIHTKLLQQDGFWCFAVFGLV